MLNLRLLVKRLPIVSLFVPLSFLPHFLTSSAKFKALLSNCSTVVDYFIRLCPSPAPMRVPMSYPFSHRATIPIRICWFAWLLCLCTFTGSTFAFARQWDFSQRTPSPFLSSASLEDYDELQLDFPRRDDVLVALSAVRKACRVTNQLQPSDADGISTVTKTDLSPVTVADLAAQALVLDHLHVSFPEDSFIAEESSTSLDKDANLAEQILAASSMQNVEHIKKSIDLGKDYLNWEQQGGRPPRVWCLDPIDGTKGFLRGKPQGGQYCVALALLEDGVPTIGILGCPNMPTSASDFNYAWKDGETEENNDGTRGCVFVASRGGGCYQLPLVPGTPIQRIHVTPNDESTLKVDEARFCVGVEKFSDALGQCRGMALVIHGDGALNENGEIIRASRIDSQAKHGVIARAGAEFYVRLTCPGYVEWIWDHAAGNVVIEEAGGTMTDVEGNPIDFSLGAHLSAGVTGVLASNGGVFHSALVEAYRKQEKSRLAGSSSLSSSSSSSNASD